MEAKKLIKTLREGEYELKRWHILPVDIDEQLLRELTETWDDPEDAYFHGIASDFDGNLVWIEVNDFMIALTELQNTNMDNDEIDETITTILKQLEKFKDYTIFF